MNTNIQHKKMKWHKGAPPSVGWWPASVQQDPECLRWWNGLFWSVPLHPSSSKKDVANYSAIKSLNSGAYIRWAKQWWL